MVSRLLIGCYDVIDGSGSYRDNFARRPGAETGRVAGIVKSRGRDIYSAREVLVETVKKERGDD